MLAQTTVRAPSNDGLGDCGRHTGVFKRRRGIAALMLRDAIRESGIFRAAWRVVKRRVAFEKSDDRGAVFEWKQLAIAPDAAAVLRIARSGTRLPTFGQIAGSLSGFERDFDFQRAAAARADVNLFANSRNCAAQEGTMQRCTTLRRAAFWRHRGLLLRSGSLILRRGRRFVRSRMIQRKFTMCTAQQRLFHVLLATTNEILVSEEPWAMAIMLTFSRPSDAEGAAGHAHSAAHVFADHGDDGDVGVHGDVFDFFDARDPARIACAARRRCVSRRRRKR